MPNAMINAAAAASPAIPAAAATRRTEAMSEKFLTLLVAQMKNQTPLNPMESAQVTSQIAQINMVSGINKLNDTLGGITDQINTTQRLQASALIGHKILVPGNEISVGATADGVATTPFGIELPKAASEVTLTITDGSGIVVHQAVFTNQSAGIQSYYWDGVDATGTAVEAGSYNVSIRAIAPDGSLIDAQPLTMGLVNGVVAGDNGPKLDLGPNGMVTLDDVRQIIS